MGVVAVGVDPLTEGSVPAGGGDSTTTTVSLDSSFGKSCALTIELACLAAWTSRTFVALAIASIVTLPL